MKKAGMRSRRRRRAALSAAAAAGVAASAWTVWQRVISMTTLPMFARLVGEIAAAEPGMSIYDPSAGAGMLLRAARIAAHEQGATRAGSVQLFGQELDPLAIAVARTAFARSDDPVTLVRGDTLRAPAFVDGGRVRQFDVVVANPVWEQSVGRELYMSDPYDRFAHGIPPVESADWGWVQHCLASTTEEGRVAMVIDTGALHQRRDVSAEEDAEAAIRRSILESGVVEAVVWCVPDSPYLPVRWLDARLSRALAQSAIVVMNRMPRTPGQVLMIDAATIFRHSGLHPVATIDAIVNAYRRGAEGIGVVRTDVEALIAQGCDLRPAPNLQTAA